MLKCFLFGIVIQINHVVEADESKHSMLGNYCTDYNTIQRSLYPHTCSLQYTVEKYIHDKEAREEKAEDTLSGILSTIVSFFIRHLKY